MYFHKTKAEGRNFETLATSENTFSSLSLGTNSWNISDENPDQVEIISIKSPEKKKKMTKSRTTQKKMPQKKTQKKINTLGNKINKSIDDMVKKHNELQSKKIQLNLIRKSTQNPTISGENAIPIEIQVQVSNNTSDENDNTTRVPPIETPVTILKPPSSVYVKKS